MAIIGEQVYIDQPQEDTPVFIDDSNNVSPQASDRTISKQAQVAEYGSGNILKMDKQGISEAMTRGQDGELRNQTAAVVDRNRADYRLAVLTHFAKVYEESEGEKVPFEVYQKMLNMDLNQPTDPNVTFEQNYAQKFVDSLQEHAKNMHVQLPEGGTPVSDIERRALEQAKSKSIDYIATNQLIDKYRNKMNDAAERQTWGGRAVDFTKQLIPGYNEWSLRSGLASNWNFTGSQMEETRKALYLLPLSEQDKFLKERFEYYSQNNPSQGRTFFDAMHMQSANEETLNNFFSIADITGLGGILKGIGKLTGRAGKAAVEFNKAKNLGESLVREAATSEETPKVAVAIATGDLKTAAAVKTIENVTPPVGYDGMLKRFMDYVPNFFRIDRDAILGDDRTALSSTHKAILADDQNVSAELAMSTIADTNKISRIPLQNVTEETLKGHYDRAKALMKGVKNAILDVSNPWYFKPTNTIHYDVKIGDYNGELFASIEQAQAFAKENKLNGIIVEGEGRVTRQQGWAEPRRKNISEEEDARWADDGGPVRDEPEPIIVTQQGLGYYIQVTKNIDERHNIWKDLLIATERDRSAIKLADPDTPDSIGKWVKGYVNFLRTSEETLSRTESELRKIGAYSPSKYFEVFHNDSKYVLDLMDGTKRVDEFGNTVPAWKRILGTTYNKLNPINRYNNRERMETFLRAVDYAQEAGDVANKRIGYWFQKPHELDDFYQSILGRNADFVEHRAYNAMKRAYEYERLVRNFSELRFKTRVGAETHTIGIVDETGKTVKSPEFDGVIRDTLPAEDEYVAIIKDNNKLNVVAADRLPQKTREALAKDNKTKIIELYNPDSLPLQGFAGLNKQVKYVIATDVDTKQLGIHQVNRVGGGHFDYDYNYYIKQPNITFSPSGRAIYRGDNTLMPIDNRVMGKDIADRFNKLRQLLKDKKIDEAKDFAKDLPMRWDELENWFFGKTVDGKRIPPRLNLEDDFAVVPKNKHIFDVNSKLEQLYDPSGSGTFRNRANTGSLANLYKTEFTQARDAERLFTFSNDGTVSQPVYKYQPARLIDPLTMLNRGMSRIVNSSFMDDYKMYAVEHWLKEAQKVGALKASAQDVRSAPNFYFNNAATGYREGLDEATKGLLEANRLKIQSFVGTPDIFDKFVQGINQKLVDAAYSSAGPVEKRGFLTRVVTVQGIDALSRVQDPIKFMRSMAFHYNLGFFNIPQFFIQAQGFSNILAISPTRAVPAMAATMMHGWANINPSHIGKLDDAMTKLRIPGFGHWKTGEFTESVAEYNKSGFGNVGGEHSIRDNFHTKTFTQGDIARGLNAGTYFFQKGEQSVRMAAWHTAFKEFRDDFPLKKITDLDRQRILDRADLLNNNMSRASEAGWVDKFAGGILTPGAQFLTYQARLGELFYGKRIDKMAKARLVAFNGMIYGLPTSLGVMGLPANDRINNIAESLGYIPGQSTLPTALMAGIPSLMFAMISGGGDIQKGTVLNVGSSWGLQGWTNVENLLSGDKTFMSVMAGASGSILSKQASSLFSDPYRKAIAWWNGDEAYPFNIREWAVKNLTEIKSISAGTRLWLAWNTGKLYSQSGILEDDSVSNSMATFQTLLRLKNVKTDDAYRDIKNGTAQTEAWKKARTAFLEQYRMYLRNEKDNPELANEYFLKSMAILDQYGVPYDDRGDFLAQGNRDQESIIDQRIANKLRPETASTRGSNIFRQGDTYQKRINRAAEELELQNKRKQ